MISILLIPASLCFTFGRNVKDSKQGRAIFIAMMIVLVAAFAVVAVREQNGTPQLANNHQVDLASINQPGGNMEGKESRFGIASSVTWSVFTTAASNGSVNSMLDFAILTVFIAGLMIGRTPEYLGKKIESTEMKMVSVLCFATPVAILIGSAIAAVWPGITNSFNNTGVHGFSEILHSFASVSGNNGSAFAGFHADTVILNISLGICMLFVRFAPMMAVLSIAGSLAKKKKIAATAGTLSTSNGTFIALLIFIVRMSLY